MPTIAFSIPILPGQTTAFRSAHQRFAIERSTDFSASRRRLGVRRELGFLQKTPGGDVAVVVFDVEDVERFFVGSATSQESIDTDFRAYLLDTFGLDLTQPAPLPELVFDFQ